MTGTGNYQGVPVIFVNDEMYPFNSIMAVGKLPEIPEEPRGPVRGGDGDGTGRRRRESAGGAPGRFERAAGAVQRRDRAEWSMR